MNKPLCYAPFYVSCIKNNKHKPCCVYDGYFPIKNNRFWSDEEIRNIRLDLLSGRFPKGCNNCKVKYDKNKKSKLDEYNDYFEKNLKDKISINVETGNQEKEPFEIDFRYSNKCNLKCRMCNPASSNLIAKEVLENKELQNFPK